SGHQVANIRASSVHDQVSRNARVAEILPHHHRGAASQQRHLQHQAVEQRPAAGLARPGLPLMLEQYIYDGKTYFKIPGASKYMSISNNAYIGFYGSYTMRAPLRPALVAVGRNAGDSLVR